MRCRYPRRRVSTPPHGVWCTTAPARNLAHHVTDTPRERAHDRCWVVAPTVTGTPLDPTSPRTAGPGPGWWVGAPGPPRWMTTPKAAPTPLHRRLEMVTLRNCGSRMGRWGMRSKAVLSPRRGRSVADQGGDRVGGSRPAGHGGSATGQPQRPPRAARRGQPGHPEGRSAARPGQARRSPAPPPLRPPEEPRGRRCAQASSRSVPGAGVARTSPARRTRAWSPSFRSRLDLAPADAAP